MVHLMVLGWLLDAGRLSTYKLLITIINFIEKESLLREVTRAKLGSLGR